MRHDQPPVFPPAAILPYNAMLDRPDRPYPFAARHQCNGRELVFIAATHEFDVTGPTHALIDRELARFKPQAVIVEGMETTSPTGWEAEVEAFYLARVRHMQAETPGHLPESYYTLLRAREAGAAILSGEPSEPAQRAHLCAHGYNAEDYAALMFLWTIAHWRLAGIVATELPAIWARIFQHHRPHVSPRLTAGFTSFATLYRRTTGDDFTLDLIDAHFVAPDLAKPHGAFGHQAGVLSLFRDMTLLGVIGNALQEQRRVMAVYGGSHYGSLEPALIAGFGGKGSFAASSPP